LTIVDLRRKKVGNALVHQQSQHLTRRFDLSRVFATRLMCMPSARRSSVSRIDYSLRDIQAARIDYCIEREFMAALCELAAAEH
jgi:hypothetical protein